MTQPEKDKKLEEEKAIENREQAITGIWDNVKAFLDDLLDIRKESDRSETVESVRKDISFQGHNAWILIFSIFVASIGLNVDSTAVVIGAMLISPLMGPIVGMGLGVAINDNVMLRRSLINLGVMVGLSLLAASLYFVISPIKAPTDEIIARTFPTLLDVLVAIFGGLALIVAKAKKGTISNAIAGVAIATALMPPLCVAGYGIAQWDLSTFGGAMYLFSINAVFIALATFVVCKTLQFPMVKYANQAKRKQVSRWATVIGIAVVAPSIYLFYELYKGEIYKVQVKEFVGEEIQHNGTRITSEWDIKDKTLFVVLYGEEVPQSKLDEWTQEFNERKVFDDCKITFYQSSTTIVESGNENLAKIQEERINDFKLIKDKDERINALENELRRVNEQSRTFDVLSAEAGVLYPEIKNLAYAPLVSKDLLSSEKDTIDVFKVAFRDSMALDSRVRIKTKLGKWLRFRLGAQSIEIQERGEAIYISQDTIKPVKARSKI